MKTFFIFLLFISSHSRSQAQNLSNDTALRARTLTNEKKFREANDLLSNYNSNKTELITLRQQAELLYWMKQPKEALVVYRRAYTAFPSDSLLQREYAKFLLENNKFYQAKTLLQALLKKDKENTEIIRMLAYIDLWTGNTSEARRKANLLVQIQPGNIHSADILKTITDYTTPVSTLNGGLYTDDQPMKRYTFNAEGEMYRSWYFAPYVGATLHQFNIGDAKRRTSWLRAGNKFSVAPTKTNIDISAGSFRAREQNVGTTYRVKVLQKFTPHFTIDGSIEKKPYQYTLSSIHLPFLYDVSEVGLSYNRKDRWLGRTAYQYQGFADTNSVSIGYAWVLAPVLHNDNISVKAGYGFSYSDAKENTFRPKQQNGTVVIGTSIEGVYDPYFTPFDQAVHSILASANYHFTEKTSLATNISVGFAASAYQPYHYVEGGIIGQLFINKQYVKYRYNPIEFSADLRSTISRSCILNLNYQYNSLIFFKSHFLNLQLKYLFLNAKQRI